MHIGPGISLVSTRTPFQLGAEPKWGRGRETNTRRDNTHHNTQTMLLRGGAEEAHERRHFGMS